ESERLVGRAAPGDGWRVSARARSCPLKREAPAGHNSHGGFGFALSAVTWREASFRSKTASVRLRNRWLYWIASVSTKTSRVLNPCSRDACGARAGARSTRL